MPVEKQNRRLVLFLGIFSILVVMVGYFQFKNAIYAPFGGVSKQQASKQVEEELGMLVMQDVDKDGLTDFDEQFIYNTSAYIIDTDSDAYSDKEEIDAGSNPLDKESTPHHLESSGEGVEKTFPAPEQTQEGIPFFEQDMSAEEIRELLINSGIDKELVDKLDDKTLIKLYNETIQETSIELEELTAPDKAER